jgi:Na+/H+ antiporter NhaD/arsenite permease-like protein
VLTVISLVLSNTVSNVPAVMLLIQFLDQSRSIPWYVLALSSTFAGNLITIGSIANLITIEQAAQYGVTISFKEHARVGIPITLGSFLILMCWIWVAI